MIDEQHYMTVPTLKGMGTLKEPTRLLIDVVLLMQQVTLRRVDVLELLPWLKPLMLDTGLWPVGMNRIMKWMYPLIIASLFLGPQVTPVRDLV